MPGLMVILANLAFFSEASVEARSLGRQAGGNSLSFAVTSEPALRHAFGGQYASALAGDQNFRTKRCSGWSVQRLFPVESQQI